MGDTRDPLPREDWVRRCNVVEVIDGDTLEVAIDLGFHLMAKHRVRLWGVSAPELFSGDDRIHGRAARQRLLEWVRQHSECGTDAGWPMLIQTDKSKQTFGRYIGRLWCSHHDDCTDDLPVVWPELFQKGER